jgi:hypothetical protein
MQRNAASIRGARLYKEVQMKKFNAYRVCSALAAIAALAVASGAGYKF